MYRIKVFNRCKETIKYYTKTYNFKTVLPTQNTIQDMPHPKELPLIGTKLDFFMFGGGTK